MSREIKFRVWYPTDKRILPVQRIQLKTGMILPYGWNMQYKELFSEPMQYTGLKDKNGKEIYEGDIVTFEADEPMTNTHLGEVKYTPTMFYVETRSPSINAEHKYWSPILSGWKNMRQDTLEVIGNIYENSELLQEVQHG